jgi:hypothetical protein
MDVEKMESSFKIDLRDVSWWMSVKNVYRPKVLVIVKLSKEGCISLSIRNNNNSFKVDIL